MRKIFSVLLVLALCGIASASLDVFITDSAGNSEVSGLAESDYLSLLVWYTWAEGTLGSLDMEIGSNDHLAGTLAQPVVTAGGRNSIYDYVGAGATLDWEFNASTDIGGGLTKGMANPLATLLFHCEGPGDVTISGLNVFTVNNADPRIEIVPTYHSMIIHQVPEPATIALLCLGGLLLKRKK